MLCWLHDLSVLKCDTVFRDVFRAGSTIYNRKILLLNLSVQVAFWSRNLVCSYDFLIAEQFFNWMDTDCLLQQSFDHLKEQ